MSGVVLVLAFLAGVVDAKENLERTSAHGISPERAVAPGVVTDAEGG